METANYYPNTQEELFENLKTQIEYFYEYESQLGDRVFLRQPYGDQWVDITFKEAGEQARRVVTALYDSGLQKGDHVGLLAKNCCHWIIADIALMIGGFVSVPYYANLGGDSLQEVIAKSEIKAIIVGRIDDWDFVAEGIPDEIKVFSLPQYKDHAVITRGMSWDEIQKNEPYAASPIPQLSDLWTILFTSGTTGSPKGVMHDYENCALIIRSDKLNDNVLVQSTEYPTFFSFMPLNHIAERAAVELAALNTGGSISFSETLETFGQNLRDTQPTFFFAVPRIWTKFYLGILQNLPQEKLDMMLSNPESAEATKAYIKQSLGLSRAKVVLTGASITPESLKQWYRKIGINLREVYGMTENYGAFTTMPIDQHKPNTVGYPIPNAEGKIDPETGEIMMKMPWMMKGYYKEEDKTNEVLTEDKWLRTGDKGVMDNDGFIQIVGRVKDAFKTAKGKYVVPTIIEERFSENENIEQICVVGLGLVQPMALVVLSEKGRCCAKEEVHSSLDAHLKMANSSLAHHEVISTIIIMNEPWTAENELLTPTLKTRRGAIDDRYREMYEQWEAMPEKVVWW